MGTCGHRFLLLIALAGLAGCPKKGIVRGEGPEMQPLGTRTDDDGSEVEMFDLSGDRKADLWKVYKVEVDAAGKKKRTLIRRDMDLNFDGKVDIRQFIGPTGELVREEMDMDFDDRIDAVAHYKNGKLYKREMDLTFDGHADVVRYYEEGLLVRKERDTNKDGRIDTWEYYEKGRLVRIGRDKDGDGTPELFDEAPEPEPELPPDEKPKA